MQKRKLTLKQKVELDAFDSHSEISCDRWFLGMLFIMSLIGMALLLVSCKTSFAYERIDLKAISLIESSGCIKKINVGEQAYGCHQIRAGALSDYNRYNKNDQHELKDMLNDGVSFKVADEYINHIIPIYLKNWRMPDTAEHRIIAYNWGIGSLKAWYFAGAKKDKLPTTTKDYLKKYKKYKSRITTE